jgi:hypothetical protein
VPGYKVFIGTGRETKYYLLTILDVYSRMALRQILKSSIRKHYVIALFRPIDLQHGISGVKIRNHNGYQFIANDVKRIFRNRRQSRSLRISPHQKRMRTSKPFTASCNAKWLRETIFVAATKPSKLSSDICTGITKKGSIPLLAASRRAKNGINTRNKKPSLTLS